MRCVLEKLLFKEKHIIIIYTHLKNWIFGLENEVIV